MELLPVCLWQEGPSLFPSGRWAAGFDVEPIAAIVVAVTRPAGVKHVDQNPVADFRPIHLPLFFENDGRKGNIDTTALVSNDASH